MGVAGGQAGFQAKNDGQNSQKLDETSGFSRTFGRKLTGIERF